MVVHFIIKQQAPHCPGAPANPLNHDSFLMEEMGISHFYLEDGGVKVFVINEY